MSKSIFPVLAATFLATALPLAASAGAQTRPLSQEVVSYSDLDLNSEAGRQELGRRVKHAAARVCPNSLGLRGRAQRKGRDCVQQAVNKAWSDIYDQQQRVARSETTKAKRG